MHTKFKLASVVSTALLLSGCFIEDDKKRVDVDDDGGTPPALNTPPTITGSPSANILEGEAYEFMPAASDADGDTLAFSIARKPAWATFDSATGRLSGTPDSEDVGNFTNIGISVSDGQAAAVLANFNISVNGTALGAATLSWNPPTENSDGSVLSNLAGYRIYYGRNANSFGQSAVLNNPGLTRYVVENLSPAKWYFTITSVNASGVESVRAATVSKIIT
jgi:hypothetical protein